jgi:NAD(P)H-nitrite reductase large subunit
MMNSVEVANIPTISIGMIKPPTQDAYEVIKRYDRGSNIYRKIILKDNLIVGALFVGNIDRAGIVTGLLKDAIKVKGFKKELRNDSLGFISLPKELRKERLFKGI